jgi:S-adenosylmethionine-diacylglycerol 3-amino-3-carboxypropyl transferase
MTTEIGKNADFSQLRYAQCWEDADLLLRALTPARHHRLLSIASAGDNTLALVAQGPERVVALDLSAVQIAALELRVAAYRQLEYPAAMQLLGVHPSKQRIDLYAACRPLLSIASQRYWDEHSDDIQAGVIAQGRFERYLRVFSQRILPLIHSREVCNALLQRRNLVARCKFYTTMWDTWRWRLLFRTFFSRFIMGAFGRDPAFFRYAEGDIATRILNRTRDALTLLDPTRNAYLQWILLGRHGTALPFALRPQNFQAIRRHLNRLEWHTASLEEYLAGTNPAQFDAFNLSNVFEYMSLSSYHAALELIIRAARPNARLVYWNLFVPRRSPIDFANRLLSLDNLAANLHRQDHAFFYNALVIEQVMDTPQTHSLG